METPPEAPARAQWTQRGNLGPYWRLTVTRCPFCHRVHIHGGGNDPAGPSYGQRGAHCRSAELRNYTLVPA